MLRWLCKHGYQPTLNNRGFHNHSSQVDGDINPPASHTEHRNLYAELLDGLGDKEESE
jgi:type VI secretion system secreted protein VgrG